jgi:hypothetical protein
MKETCPALRAGHSVKAMRGRIALQKHLVRNPCEALLCFAPAFGVRARPRAAFTTIFYALTSLTVRKSERLACSRF